MRILVVLVASLMVGTIAGCGQEKASEESQTTKEESKNAVENATPTKAPLEPYVLSGSGQAVTQAFNLEAGLRTFEIDYVGAPKPENFSVELLNRDGTGRDSELLFNEVTQAGSGFSGSQAVQVRTRGVYVLQVKAGGPWEVAIT